MPEAAICSCHIITDRVCRQASTPLTFMQFLLGSQLFSSKVKATSYNTSTDGWKSVYSLQIVCLLSLQLPLTKTLRIGEADGIQPILNTHTHTKKALTQTSA